MWFLTTQISTPNFHVVQGPNVGCEGDLAVTSVTPLIARVDLADLVGWWCALPPLTALSRGIPLLKLHAGPKRTTFLERGGSVFSEGYLSSCDSLLEAANKLLSSICRGS